LRRARAQSGFFLFDLLAVAVIGTAFAGGFMLLQPRSAVDWTASRGVVIESDDWGFCGFTPSRAALDGIDVDVISPGDFPPIYLLSTLESADTVERIADLMSAHRGRDGVPAVFQPNYIMGSLSYLEDGPRGGESPWRKRLLPDLPDEYHRDGLWPTVHDVIAAGLWWPEYHGLWHYDPEDRRSKVAGLVEARDAARQGLLIFPGCARSYELSLGRDPAQLRNELREGQDAFEALFGRRPSSIIAPDYAWNRDREIMWADAGFAIIQAKREQSSLDKLDVSLWDRVWKVCRRSWSYLTERQLVYLNRNCRLEGAQVADADRHVERCLESVGKAWRSGEPAIIGTHRVNYAHLDPGSTAVGFDTLGRVLDRLGDDPEGGPIYLTDEETRQLIRFGTSQRVCGRRLVLRNMTHSRRPVRLPAGDGLSQRVVWMNPRTTQVIDLPASSAD